MKTTITALFTITLLFISYRSLTNGAGPPPELTSAPGEGNCSNCHGPTITSGTVSNSMNLTVVGATLGTLVQNTTYTFNLSFTDASSVKYGFQLCVLQSGANSSTSSLGTLISTSGATQIVSGSSFTRDYLTHTSSGTSAPGGTKTWTFQWTTPPSYTGGAVFYVVVNSTNSNSSNDFGDEIYPKTFSATISLPVNWLYIKAEADKKDALISWATASETNNWKFEVERSNDRKEWISIGSVKGKGNSSIANKYSFRDENVTGEVYYRVKQIDYNGEFSYSDMVTAMVTADINEPSIAFDADKPGYVVKGSGVTGINVTNMTGETKYVSAGDEVIPALAPGVYLVRIQTSSKTYYQKLLMH